MPLTDNDQMPWGKYKNTKMTNVPSEYLIWLYENDKAGTGDVRRYIFENLAVLREEVKRKQQKDGKHNNYRD